MKELMAALGDFFILPISGLIPIGNEFISKEAFLEVYSCYVAALKHGELPNDSQVRPFFTSIWTVTLEAVYAVPVKPGHNLIKVCQPVIQLQGHRFDYSTVDGKFRSMVLGSDSVQWGLQFSYPQLYQDENLQVFSTKEGAQFPNTAVFKRVQQWMRSHTIATPFEVEGKKINVPIRLGKQCLSWVNHHPQLQAKGLRVITSYSQ